MDRHAPIRELSRKEQLKIKPWINKFILKKIAHRNKLFVRKKRDPSNLNLRPAYNLFRNSVKRDIGASKKKYYYASYFENCKQYEKHMERYS